VNRRSKHLVIVVGSRDRLPSLHRSLESIRTGTRTDHEIIVADAGSGSETLAYLRGRADVTLVEQGRLLGYSRAFNEVLRRVDSEFVTFMSDDTETIPGVLDEAIAALESDPQIGMVGLKMKDTIGPWSDEAYLGGLSELGVLTANHGLLRTSLFRALGFFNEDYRSYSADADLTASVLASGRHVVMTKRVSVLHHREWVLSDPGKMRRDIAGVDNDEVYRRKFGFLRGARGFTSRVRGPIGRVLLHTLYSTNLRRLGLSRRDVRNLAWAWFIRPDDPLRTRGLPYHLVQSVHRAALDVPDNPYRALLPTLGGADRGGSSNL